MAFIDIIDNELANASACSPRNTVNWCIAQVYDAGVFKKTRFMAQICKDSERIKTRIKKQKTELQNPKSETSHVKKRVP